MADLSDVEVALLGYVSAALYPAGTSGISAIGADCRVYRGWPTPGSLNADLAAGRVNVSIFPDKSEGRTTTRYAPVWSSIMGSTGLTVSINSDTLTFVGSVGGNVIVGVYTNHKSYVYIPAATDSPQLVAANIAVQIRADRVVSLSGSNVTIPGASDLVARVVPTGTAVTEARRQERELRVICWCPTPTLRDVTAATIDAALACKRFIETADSSQVRLSYYGTQVYDQAQNAMLFRRDLIYTVEYPTMISMPAPAMLFGDLSVNADNITV